MNAVFKKNEVTTITLRDYQQASVDLTFEYWKKTKGDDGVLVLPTAAGKTVVAAAIIKRLMTEYPSAKILFLAHRKELVEQSEKKILEFWPSAPVGCYAAALKRKEIARITVASRDTLQPALEKIPGYSPTIVIVDECHNISTKPESRYQKLLTELRNRNPNMITLGITATPFRATSGIIYGEDAPFDGLINQVWMRDLLTAGHLSPVFNPKVNPDAMVDTSKINIVNGEFNQTKLAAASLSPEKVRDAIADWRTTAYEGGRKHTLFFGVSVAHAESMQTELSLHGFDVPVVTGKTTPALRERAIQRFLSGEVVGLINVGVFTEGTDFPLIDCICNLRPVHSLGLWLQIVGRGMRTSIATEKVDCMVLDFGGCGARFGPIDMAQPADRRSKDKRMKDCPECNCEVGFNRRKCDCGHVFLEIVPGTKDCERCGSENPARCDKCLACGEVFVTHESEASDSPMLSTELSFKTYDVDQPPAAFVMISKKSGNEYLKVTYEVSLTKVINRTLCIGYEGSIGTKHLRQFMSMCIDGTPEPATPEEARRLVSGGHLKQPAQIVVNQCGKYPEICHIKYSDDAAEVL